MGLEKEIVLNNGITLSYHRIVSLMVFVNRQNVIEVSSYISQSARQEEMDASLIEADDVGEYSYDVFVSTSYFTTDYDPDMSVVTAYDYLKSLPEFQGASDIIEKWQAGNAYIVGDLVMYGDEDHEEARYECIQAHTSQEGWEPPSVPALWRVQSSGGDIPVWVQPDSANPYMAGDKVRYPDADGPIYESLIDNNVWSPEAYPQGWQLVEGGE